MYREKLPLDFYSHIFEISDIKQMKNLLHSKIIEKLIEKKTILVEINEVKSFKSPPVRKNTFSREYNNI